MAIPKKEDLVKELVVFLSARNAHRAPCDDVYEELVHYFPSVTHSEKYDKYSNSKSKSANRVQYARLLGVQESLIHSEGTGPQPRRGVWVLTDDGIDASRRWRTSTIVGQQQMAAAKSQEFEERVRMDLSAIEVEHEFFEGAKHQRLSSYYERRPELRAAAIRIHGTACKGCTFDFRITYGPHGQDFIEVHHLKPVSTLGKNVVVNPENDMTVLCANCHRMVHRNGDKPLTIANLRKILRQYSTS